MQLTVTRDFGAQVLVQARAAPDQSAMNALRRNARVATAYAGRYVNGINGIPGSSGGHDWFFYINGVAANRGATAYSLKQGDHEWWDYRYWALYQNVPLVIGSWPEPFVHGYDHPHPVVRVSGPCSAPVRKALQTAGARLTSGTTNYTVVVKTFDQAESALGAGQTQFRGLTIWLHNGEVLVYNGKTGVPIPAARALIEAYQPGRATGGSATLVIAGATPAAACAAARTLAIDPAAVRHTYAVAMDATGHVVARGGQP